VSQGAQAGVGGRRQDSEGSQARQVGVEIRWLFLAPQDALYLAYAVALSS
jgi:hypothetical protein